MKRTQLFLLISTLIVSSCVQAKPLTAENVPEPLQPWVEWVLQDNGNYRCPFLYNSFDNKRCSWPSQLKLDIDKTSATFSVQWKVFAESWVQLPGGTKYWPLGVTINQEPAVVLERQGKPMIKLQPGVFNVNGKILWDSVPDNLQVPGDVGLIALTVFGKPIEFPAVNQGRLWLKGGNENQFKAQSIENKFDLQVFRRIDDDIPLQLLTRLDLQVAGEQRELKLALPMLDFFIPMQLNSSLPARIEPDRSLLLQLRPGRWQIDIRTRHTGPVTQLEFKRRAKNWPEEEIWVFAAHPHLRLVEIEKVRAVDAQLTNLPDAWKKLPAYRVKSGDTMQFKVIRRGDPDPEPDKLNMTKTLWLDFDGGGYTVNDQINGRMTHSWRLNTVASINLGKVSLDGKNQLITRLPGSKQEGVEVRKGELHMSADSRIGGPVDNIDALGWNQDFHQVNAVLNLPPGWRLFAANGIDNVPESWVSRWTLLDLFLVLIAALATGRLWNYYWGAFALLTLALIWHEPGAPRFIWLNILAALALLRVLPPGKLQTLVKFYRNGAWIVLLVLLIPFLVDQVRVGLYPQLEMPWKSIGPEFVQEKMPSRAASAPVPQALEKSLPQQAPLAKSLSPQISLFSEADKALNDEADYIRVDPKANIQTGPGLPQWQWQEINLSWNGPVEAGQKIRFWYLGPGMTMTLHFLRALLVGILALLVFGAFKGKFVSRMNSALVGLLLLPLLSFPVGTAEAAFPDARLLKDLKSRLLKAPDCLPGCAQIAQMELKLSTQGIVIALQVELGERVAMPLPGQAKQWLPETVLIDGQPAESLYRSQDGILWITLDPGNYALRMEGRAPRVNQFSLPLPLNPHRITSQAEGWLIEGIHENRSSAGQLYITRQRSKNREDLKVTLEPGILPPFVQVERTLQLGLDWQVQTRVVRVTEPGTAIVLKVPLLTSESVTTAGIRVENGKVLVNMPANQKVLQWRSALEKTPRIELVATQTQKWTEVWRADVSPIWHMESKGIAVVHHQDRKGRWLPEWRPWPGESVVLSVSRPEAVAGQTLTIDNSQVKVTPGKRSREVALDVTLRSSQGTQHIFTLPEHAELQAVIIDNRSQPIRQRGRELPLPVKPGKQIYKITWREPKPIATVLTTPEVNLGVASVNTFLNVNLGQDRWTLLTSGPAFGPAVLFWGVLLVIAVFSYALGKTSLTPLKHWQWFLLLIGLSQIAVGAALLVVAWLFILGFRQKNVLQKDVVFNLLQIGIVLLTLVVFTLLFLAINQGLLGSPEMQIQGNLSSAHHLNWYQDRSAEILPQAKVISIPLAVYRLLMLAWSLWLAVSLLNWLKWGWVCFSNGGFWRKRKPKQKKADSGNSKLQKES